MLAASARIGALAALLAAFTASPALAQNWSPSCQGPSRQADLTCTASEAIVAKPTGQILMVMEVVVTGHGKDPMLSLRLPKDIFIPSGVGVAIDDRDVMKLAVETCTEAGCVASGPISRATLAALEQGKAVTVSFDNAAKRPVKLTMPLADFAASFAAIE